jgi:polyribonucleotide nucleotidyltransferase
MATVCSTSMALMDAGVPIKAPVAGVAMGLITDDEGNLAILTDIQGIEDHVGDMDFKVTGTEKGITALQMDIKIEGITREVLAHALEQAREARLYILGKMAESVTIARAEMKPHTPRITTVMVPVDRIREVIGSGGKVIRDIVEKSGAKVDIEDSGACYVMAEDAAAAQKAIDMIRAIIRQIEPGEIITGKVIRVIESGAIVDLGGGKDGMCHISELEHRRVAAVTDVVNEGDMVTVKVLEVDKERGRVKLSRKALIPREDGTLEEERPRGGDRGDRGDRGGRGDRGDRGGFRGDRGGDRGDRGDRGGDRGGDRPAPAAQPAPAPAPAAEATGDAEARRPRRPRPPRGNREDEV